MIEKILYMPKNTKKEKTVYFVAPTTQIANEAKPHDNIVTMLKDCGYKVWSQKTISKSQTEIKQLIRNADLFIAEISEPSSSVGYEIGLAAAFSRPMLILISEDRRESLDAPFLENEPKIITVRYSKSNLKKQLQKYLTRAEKGIFTKRMVVRFTQEQVDYVEAKKLRDKTKSFNATVRDIISEAAEQNPPHTE